MAKKQKRAVRIKRTIPKPANDVGGNLPTPERQEKNEFRSAGAAKRVVPVIEVLHRKGVLNEAEYKSLAYYRDQASLADRSPVRSCCDFSPRGGHGPGVAILSAQLETGRMEREMGALWALCRAIAVDDVTIEAWCLNHAGSRSPVHVTADPQAVGIATLELKYAAGGIIPR